MKRQAAAPLTALIFALGVAGHDVMGVLLVNGTAAPEWKYVRNVANAFDIPPRRRRPTGWEYWKVLPQWDLESRNITCGRNAFIYANETETADVLAGSEVGFRVSADILNTGSGTFLHMGPGQVYLSKLPENLPDLRGYSGYDGDWFKIAYAGPVNRTQWRLYRQPDFNFTIPRTTPPGLYLMRMEQFYPAALASRSQFYVNCAHVNIIGPGGGTPTGLARFPGTYQDGGPGLHLADSQLAGLGYPDDEINLLTYSPPGPPVWVG